MQKLKEKEELCKKIQQHNSVQQDLIDSLNRTLKFYKVENDFFRTQTTKKGRNAMREKLWQAKGSQKN